MVSEVLNSWMPLFLDQWRKSPHPQELRRIEFLDIFLDLPFRLLQFFFVIAVYRLFRFFSFLSNDPFEVSSVPRADMQICRKVERVTHAVG